LALSAYPRGLPESATSGQVNRSGVWFFQDLAGLRGYEFGADDGLASGSPPGPHELRVDVQDLQGRFLPCSFAAVAPTTGLFQFAPALSPPAFGPEVPLFSAPSRAVPSGCGVIRLELVTEDANEPAQWALVEAATTVRNRTVRAFGLADANGRVAIFLPWPEPLGLVLTSPPGGVNIAGQGWLFEVQAWYDSGAPAAEVADLDAVAAQPGRPADLLLRQLSPPEPFTRATLIFGQELIVPEQPSTSRSLIITAA
jgi:hypothetical protein